MNIANLQQRALFLSYLTVGYNVLEGIISIVAGALAGSVALLGFGLDSFVESLSGGVMIWRFAKSGGCSQAQEERQEARAVKIVGWTFLVLGVYVLYESLDKLYFQEAPSPSLLGIVIALASLIIMPVLFYVKHQTGKALNSYSLMADAKQTLACAFLSVALLVGLGLNYLYGLWQADPLMGLVIVAFLFREGYETLKEGRLCSCCSAPPRC